MNTTQWWTAALRRDPAYDGRFVFGVVTTGIYCRASCPARRPLRRNVQFFASSREAEHEGFRACKRCGSPRALAARACEFLRRHSEESVTLGRLARSLDVSPSHLQRVFARA